MTKKNPTAKNEVRQPKKNPEIVSIEKDLEKYVALENLADSAGGKVIVDNLALDIIATAEALGVRYKTASHAELLGMCADLDNKLTILRLITRAKKNKELATDALKEAIEEAGRADE